MVPRSAKERRGGAALGSLNYSTTIDRVEQPRTVCGAEECRRVPSSAGKGWGRHWGAFKLLYYHCNTTKLLYYHCNTTKIDRVEQPRTVCGAECRGVPEGVGQTLASL